MGELAPPTGSWPLLLCGPILRRVSFTSVTVFLAFSHPRTVVLQVFARGADGRANASMGQSAAQPTVRLGARLHVVAVTATGLALQPNTLYCYDVAVTKTSASADSGPANASLSGIDPNQLSGAYPLGYAIGVLPSFLTPPLKAGELNFHHGSCRKIHGGGGDALLALDRDIDMDRDRVDRRPQMLFLTGDQIYADDVAGPLLPILTELASKLLGWQEKMPDAGGPSLLTGLPPGSRSRFILRGDMTSEKGHCHLLGLGEFYAMYLMAWSPALWPLALPTADKVVPAAALAAADPDGSGEDQDIAAIRDYLAKTDWADQMRTAMDFRDGLERVRRVLANIPSYMMFDDHEVTDDWYLNAAWQTEVLTAPEGIGQRVIGNALAAYAVFQAWGNDHESFASGSDGGNLLTHLSAIGNLDGDTYRAGQSDHDGLRRALRVVPQSNATGMLWDYAFRPDARCDWQAIVLDTRTHRNLTAPGQTDLIEASDLVRQIRARTAVPAPEVTLVVSPAPVFGHPFVEELVEGILEKIPDEGELPKIGTKGHMRSVLDNEAWRQAGAPAAFEQLLAELSRLGRVVILSGDVHYGFSAAAWYWNRRQGSDTRAAMVQLCSSALKNESVETSIVGSLGSREFRPLLARILNDATASTRRRLAETLVTSGRLQIIAPLALQGPLLKAQLWIMTAGTLLEVGVQVGPDVVAAIAPALAPPGETDYLGWDSIIPRVPRDSKLRQPETRPAVIKIQGAVETTGLPPAEWSYRVRFCSDLSPDQGLPEPVAFGLETSAQRRQRLKEELITCGPSTQHRLVVGQSNIGRVRILGSSGQLRVRHDLERIDGTRYPVTTHLLPLASPGIDEPEPGRSVLDAVQDLSIWMDILSFKPDPTMGLDLPGVESGTGWVRLDCYGVKVTAAPTRLPGETASRTVRLQEFMSSLRRAMLQQDVLFDAELGGFSCVPASDSARWEGTPADAIGCRLMLHVLRRASLSGTPIDSPVPLVACEVLDSGFVLSAERSGAGIGLAGNRGVFGMQTASNPDQWLIFTVGAHRSAGAIELPELGWADLHRTWDSFPAKLANLIVSLGGQAAPTRSAQHRVSWSRAAMGWFHPRHPQ